MNQLISTGLRVTCLGLLSAIAGCAAVGPDEAGGEGSESAAAAISSSRIVQIAVGTTLDCVRREDRTVTCWHFKLTSSGPPSYSVIWTPSAPYQIAGIDDAIDVAASNGYACAARASGRVSCWRPGATAAVATIAGISDAVGVAARPAIDSACARRAGGDVACWGYLDSLGSYSQPFSASAVPVANIAGATALVNRCARLSTGRLTCWSGGSGERRPPTNDGTPQVPTAMPTLGAAAVSFGVSQSTILEATSSGDVFGVGSPSLLNRSYLNGNPQIYPTPTQVLGVAGIKQLSVGAGHACGLKGDSTVVCWGDNIDGAIGSSNRFDSAPRAIAGLSDAVALSRDMASSSRTCALRATGQVACWGSGFGPTASLVTGL